MAGVWLITGSSRGLGRALAEAVLEAGGTLVATARKPEQLSDLVRRYGDRARAVARSRTSRAAALTHIRERTSSARHPSAPALAIRNNPAPMTTAPMTRATRSPSGARRSTVMAAVTTAIPRRFMNPNTRRIAIRPEEQ